MGVEGHERFAELALGHVLGGLPSSDAAAFRAHLVECRDCRLRVAELRDLAADLAATEREEKRQAAVATQVAERQEGDEDRRWRSSRWLPVLAVVAIVAVLGILFWNYHLRRVVDQYAGVVGRQEEVLRTLASGEGLEVDARQGVAAVAARSGESVAVSVTELPAAVADGYLVIWLLADGAVLDDRRVAPGSDPVAFSIDVGDADALVVSGHASGSAPPESPGEAPLVRVDTDGVG